MEPLLQQDLIVITVIIETMVIELLKSIPSQLFQPFSPILPSHQFLMEKPYIVWSILLSIQNLGLGIPSPINPRDPTTYIQVTI